MPSRVIVAKRLNVRETRPWSARGGRGELSHHDRHEGGAKSGTRGQSALAELCRLYWYPLYIFARRRGYSPEDAQDLTQGFFLHLLEHRALTRVNRLKGKFRSFLLASFQNHLSDAVGRARCLKRGGDKEFVQLDVEDTEERYRREPIEFLTFVPQVLPLLVCLHRSRQLVSRQPVRPLPELIRRQ